MSRAIYAPDLIPSREVARVSARFEFYGFFRLLLVAVTIPLGAWLVWWLAAHGLNLLIFRRTIPAAIPAWPGPLGIVAGALLFVVPLIVCAYGMVLLPGSPLAQTMEVDFSSGGASGWVWPWTMFWPLWGALAGWNLLVGYAGRSARRSLPARSDGDDPVCDERTKPFRRWGRRIVVGCLVASALSMLAVSIFAGDSVLGALEGVAQVVAFVFLGVLALASLLQWLDVWLWKPLAAFARGRNRWVMTGLAGGILLWSAFIGFIGQRERTYATLDTVLIPDLDREANTLFTPLEGRIVDRYRSHVRAVLQAEERARDATND